VTKIAVKILTVMDNFKNKQFRLKLLNELQLPLMTQTQIAPVDFETIISMVKQSLEEKQKTNHDDNSQICTQTQQQPLNLKKFIRAFYPTIEKSYKPADIDFVQKTALLASYESDTFNQLLREMLYKSYFSTNIEKSLELFEKYKRELTSVDPQRFEYLLQILHDRVKKDELKKLNDELTTNLKRKSVKRKTVVERKAVDNGTIIILD